MNVGYKCMSLSASNVSSIVIVVVCGMCLDAIAVVVEANSGKINKVVNGGSIRVTICVRFVPLVMCVGLEYD